MDQPATRCFEACSRQIPFLVGTRPKHPWPQATTALAVDVEHDDRVEADVATGAVRPILTSCAPARY